MISGALEALRDRAGMSAALIDNAGSLAFGNLASAVLGFLFWALAARSFPPEAVGYASAAVSLMGLAVLIGEFGLGTLLLGEIQRDLERAPRLVPAVLAGSIAMSTLCGLIAVAGCQFMKVELGDILDVATGRFLFVVACAASGFALVLDGVLIGFLKGERQLLRNTAQSVIKLLLLCGVAAAAQNGHMEFPIFAAWVASTILSIGLIAAVCARDGDRIWVTPRFDALRPQLATALRHHALDIATLAPSIILPFIVTVTLSPVINAAFFAGWMLLSVVLMMPASLTIVLFTVGTKDPAAIHHHLAVALALSALTGIAATVGFYVAGDFVLGLFNPAYPGIMGPSLKILGLSVFPVALKYHFIAVRRLQDRMLSASVVLGLGACLELAFAIAGALNYGLYGLTVGWMLATVVEAVLMAPVVFQYVSAPTSRAASM